MKFKIIAPKTATLREILRAAGLPASVRKAVRRKDVAFRDEAVLKNHTIVPAGAEITLDLPEARSAAIIPAPGALDIVYEDEYLLIVDKPAGLAIQPSRKHLTDNLASMIQGYYEQAGIEAGVHIVTRLDLATAGLVLVAKHGLVHYLLSKAPVSKIYLVKVTGRLAPAGTLTFPIKRENPISIRRRIAPDGAPAVTEFRTVAASAAESLVVARLVTGRTHQIRLHFAHLGHPVIGDALYGERGEQLYLHAAGLAFTHPMTGAPLQFTSYPSWQKEELCLF